MSKRCSEVQWRKFGAAAGFLTGLCLFTALSAPPAEARHRHHHYHRLHAHHFRHHLRLVFHLRHMRPGGSTSQFAALVIDGTTGQELYGRNENALRHPASITKVMTLYLLFEQLESGRLHLDSRIPISRHAAAQAPTKLGLRPGQSISVEEAIKAIVTQSANDIAVAVAEKIGGSEQNFAAMMTREAHELGMLRTHYANASGLPNDAQITTAHDLAILGRTVQERFPRYYHYFATRVFYYHGIAYRNHNHLLGRVDGMDGIKTGYIRASGFNLLASVKRDHHFIIAVVLGGASSASRDHIMDNLIEAHIDDASTYHSTSMVAARAPDGHAVSEDEAPRSHPSHTHRAMAAAATARTLSRSASGAAPMPVERPRPAFVSAAPKPAAVADSGDFTGSRALHASFDGSTERPTASSATPTSLRWVVGLAPVKRGAVDPKEFAKAETIRAATDPVSAEATRPSIHHSGWMIQIGATDDLAKASDLLARARAEGRHLLSRAKPFTEKIRKGSETLYRARFAGLEADAAEAACRSLKRSGFACFATKN